MRESISKILPDGSNLSSIGGFFKKKNWKRRQKVNCFLKKWSHLLAFELFQDLIVQWFDRNDIETNGFGERSEICKEKKFLSWIRKKRKEYCCEYKPALSNCDLVTLFYTESRRAVSGDVGVAFFETVVFFNVVKVVTTDDNGAFHLGWYATSSNNTTADGDVWGEWAFLVDVVSRRCFLWGFDSKTFLKFFFLWKEKKLSLKQRNHINIYLPYQYLSWSSVGF